eukprot:COSAG06_NODE_5749_length_3293_cov_23.132749_2_plen_39_part_00
MSEKAIFGTRTEIVNAVGHEVICATLASGDQARAQGRP